MKIKDRAKPKVPPVEPGVYIAICIGVVDLGEQYSEKFKNYSNKVKLVIYKRGFNSLRFSYMMKGTGLTEFQVGTPRP